MSTICPYCDSENIEGIDECQECGQPLDDLHLPTPATAVERALLDDRITVLNPKTPVSVGPDTPVRDVIRLMVDSRIGCVTVVDQNRLMGIFSERDVLLKINTAAAELADEPVSKFMTTNAQTLGSGVKVAFAVQRMDLGGYRHIPIVDDSETATGIISVRDILAYLTARMGSSE